MVSDEFTAFDTKKDQLLEVRELNKQYPMWQVEEIIKAYDAGTKDGKLDVLEYAK